MVPVFPDSTGNFPGPTRTFPGGSGSKSPFFPVFPVQPGISWAVPVETVCFFPFQPGNFPCGSAETEYRLKSSVFFGFRFFPVKPGISQTVPVEKLHFVPVPVFAGKPENMRAVIPGPEI